MKRAKRLQAENIAFERVLPQEEVLRRMVVSDFQVPWNKLYRRKLLENLRYPENKAFEDTCLMPVIYARAASACGVWDFLYNYRIVTGQCHAPQDYLENTGLGGSMVPPV